MKAARIAALASGVVVILCVIVLTLSYINARIATPKDDQLILDLQEKVQEDSSLAPELAAEHERITAARQARKSRSDLIATILIVAASGFISAVKWRQSFEPRHLPMMSELVQIATAQAPPPARRVAAAEELDLSFVAKLVAREGRGKEAAIPILQAIQNHYRYLPDQALQRVCELTEITPAQVAGTSSFYAQFRRSPAGKHFVRVCHGTACHVAGARQITEELRRYLQIPGGEDTDAGRMFTIDEVACLGCCSLAPVLMTNDQTAGRLTPATACQALDRVEQKEPA